MGESKLEAENESSSKEAVDDGRTDASEAEVQVRNPRRVRFHSSTKPETTGLEQDPFGVNIPRRIKLGKGGSAAPLRDAFFLVAIMGLMIYFATTIDVGPTKDKKPRKKDKIAIGQELNKLQKTMENLMMETMEKTRRKESCDLFTTKGSIPDSGQSVFAGRRYVKGETIYRPSFSVPLEIGNSTHLMSPLAYLIKFHPFISNVEGSLVTAADGSVESMELRTTRPIRAGEELFIPYEQHPLYILSLDNHTIFERIPSAADYKTAEAIQSEIAQSARRMEVAHSRRVQDAVRLNTGYLYSLGATITKHFAPNVAKLLPASRADLQERKDLPLPLATLDNQTLASLQLKGSCLHDVKQENFENRVALVASRDVANQELVQTVPVHITRIAEGSKSTCFSSSKLQLNVCPLTDIVWATIGMEKESNVRFSWTEKKDVQDFLKSGLSESIAGSLVVNLVAMKAIKKGEPITLFPENILRELEAPADNIETLAESSEDNTELPLSSSTEL